ncbi:MAG: TonB-dependent receptor [Candidatus Ozemobacteraceae bacterium]
MRNPRVSEMGLLQDAWWLRMGVLCLFFGISSIGYSATNNIGLAMESPASASMMVAATQVASETDAKHEKSYILPTLLIDAERGTYQGLITRPQDEISSEVIKLKPTRNPVELLTSLNSSISVSNGLLGGIFTPVLRGFDGNQTKVLIDGCPVNTPWNGASSLSGFPLRRLQKATVVPGGSSLVYGPGAMAGAVNLTLPTARDLEGLTLVQEAGSMGTHHQEYLYGRVAHKNEHLLGLFLDDEDGSRKYKTQGSGSARSDNKMFMYRGRVETDNGWAFKATILDSDGTLSIPNWSERFEPWRMSHRDFVVERDFGNEKNLILRYAAYMDFSSTQYFTDRSLTIASGPINSAEDVTIRMKTMEALFNFTAGDKHHLTIGGQKQEVQDVGHTVKPKAAGTWLDTTGMFISDNINATDKLKFHLAARNDESYASNDKESSWSVTTDYKVGSRSNLGFSVSRTLRFPNVQELYRGTKVLGNENLEAEKANNREFRFAHQLSDNWKASIAHFDSDIENKITSVVAAADAYVPGVGKVVGTGKKKDSYYINIDEAKISGWEVGVNGKINEKFDSWVSYTKLDKADDTKKNLRLASKPDFRMTGGVMYHQGRMSGMLSCEHQGKIQATKTLDTSGKATVYDKVDASTCFDLNLRWNASNDSSVYVSVENFTNQDDVVLTQGSNLTNNDLLYYRTGSKTVLGMELKF